MKAQQITRDITVTTDQSLAKWGVGVRGGGGGAASLPGVVVVVRDGDEPHGVVDCGRGRGGGGRGAGCALSPPRPQRLLVRGRARLAELVH